LALAKTLIKMKKTLYIPLLAFAAACTSNNEKNDNMRTDLTPPVAPIEAKELTMHGHTRIDNYYWMNNREDQRVIDYLNAENEYYKEMTAHTKKFQEELFEEMKSRIQEDDESVPYFRNGYYYITRYEKGKDYPIYSRKKGALNAKEEILFDCNVLAEGQKYFNLGSFSVSEDNKLALFSTDLIGRRQYTLQVKNLETGEILSDKIENTTGDGTWANDNQTFFYTKKDEVTLRSDKIYRHTLGAKSSADVLIFHEKDETFSTFIYKEKSNKYLIIGSGSTVSNEYRFLDANTPNGTFKLFQKRVRDLEHSISYYNGDFYIVTNKDGATNFKVMKCSENATSQENWVDLIPHRKDFFVQDIEIFKNYLVITERNQGLNKLRVLSWDKKKDYYLPFNSETYVAYTSTNLEFNTDILRYGYQSMTTPNSTIDFNMTTKESTVLKEQQVLGGQFDKNNYVEERIWATAADGTKIPMSMVYRKGMKKDGNNPVLQYAYGSYGYTIDPYFSTSRLSLLDRGFVYVICHIRGGQYMGREWYENGKMLKKMNTFTDFIACSKHLIAQKYTSADHLYAQGGSAGGLLMGVITNLAPELYKGIVSQVPFLDVVTTMLDETIPLTTGEFDEWGNPKNKEYYDYMLSYSPYDNIEAKAYPNILITSGFHDSQVQYWEPTKYVAKMRAMKTDKNYLFLDTNMDAGHGGASGRYEALKEVAKVYAFMLDLEGIKK
jgi:oligopeptidase B